MAPFAARAEDLPTEFPVFPLMGALLLPRGKLPLNIFEPRYLALTEDALAAGRMFGMIQPDPSRPAGESGPATFGVGCLGRLVSFSETEDGRYLITLLGLSRFRVVAESGLRRGYRRVRAEFSGFPDDLAPPPEVSGLDRAGLAADLKAYFAHHGIEGNWEAIGKMPDHDLVVTLCMACPFGPLEKQALLEAATPAERAATLQALLRMDLHAPPGTDETPHSRAS